jgi:hypothetical protein
VRFFDSREPTVVKQSCKAAICRVTKRGRGTADGAEKTLQHVFTMRADIRRTSKTHPQGHAVTRISPTSRCNMEGHKPGTAHGVIDRRSRCDDTTPTVVFLESAHRYATPAPFTGAEAPASSSPRSDTLCIPSVAINSTNYLTPAARDCFGCGISSVSGRITCFHANASVRPASCTLSLRDGRL